MSTDRLIDGRRTGRLVGAPESPSIFSYTVSCQGGQIYLYVSIYVGLGVYMHLFISTHRITPTPSLSCVTVPVPGRPGAGAQLSKSQEQMRLGEFSFLFPFFFFFRKNRWKKGPCIYQPIPFWTLFSVLASRTLMILFCSYRDITLDSPHQSYTC